VVVLAQEEARTLKHNYIGTEHILLGLLREEEGLAARVLESLEITVERVRAQVVRIVGSGEEVTSGQIPFTPRAKKVLELALRESLSLGHNYIGTEHILLGLVPENEGVAIRIRPELAPVAIRILLDLDADSQKIRNEVLRMLSGPEAQKYAEAKPPLSGRGNRYSIDQAWFDGLGGVLDGLAREIRRELEREPDTGDLLLALACAPDTLAARALRELGVNPEALPGVIERVRAQRPPSAEAQLAQRIEEVRQAKELAIESQQFQTAAAMRDQERELTQQTAADAVVAPEVIQEICRHLGIPTRTNDPPL
jgi:ATP-dependent Clp protease ATP-binding subunit ClpA